MKEKIKEYISKLKKGFILIFFSVLITIFIIFSYMELGGYTFKEAGPAIFATIIIPIIVLYVNYIVSYNLNEEEYLEKEIKHNDFFKEKEMITEEQHNQEHERIKNRIQKLDRYKKIKNKDFDDVRNEKRK